MKKILLLLFAIILLNNCAQSTALLGPAITIGNTGNILQAGYSYGSNLAIKEVTGKTPGEHVTTYVSEKKKEKKMKEQLKDYLQSHIDTMRSKIYLKSHIEKTRNKLSLTKNNS
tara:strand:- start:738 stop:1079 length:342 start_codon:yes stop_codon:yes gene_type:complete